MLKLSKTNTFTHPITVKLPTNKPNVFNSGNITVEYRVKSKEEFNTLYDKGLGDREYFDEVVVNVTGLGDEEGNAISGEAALVECKDGPWSMHLLNAIINEYYEQFGESRIKNSRPSRGR